MIATAGPGPGVVNKTLLHQLHPAMVLAGFLTGGIASLLGGWPVATGLALLALAGLLISGWKVHHIGGLLKPWWGLALLVVAVHTLTTTAVAPLGHPSRVGLYLGLVAVTRLAGVLMGLVWLQGTLEVDGLVKGLTWWLQPVDSRWFPARDIGLILAIALGTAPRVLAEGRRLQAVTRLRGGRCHGPWWRKWWSGVLAKVVVVVPLLEGLARRAETTSLALRLRRPGAEAQTGTIPPWQWGLLLGWVLVVVGFSLSWWRVL